MKSHSFACLLGLLTTASAAFADLPDWASRIVRANTKSDPAAPAAVLLNETEYNINREGINRETHRYIIHILQAAGAGRAVFSVTYNGKSDRVRSAEAWLVRHGDVVKSKGKSDWVDASSSPDGTLFDEMRTRGISFSDQAGPNDIVVFETVTEGPELVAQGGYSWAHELPTEEETLRVIVPSGFSVESFLHGTPQPELEKSADGCTWSWTLRHEPWVRDEPASPHFSAVAANLLFRLSPPPNSEFKPVTFSDWNQLEKWQEVLCAGTCDRSDKLVEEALRLTKDIPDSLGKIRALSRSVQQIRYVEVSTNLGQGDGIKPRKASLVFGRGYGDCKDKANLLCAMLREVGIRAYQVSACAEEGMPVWPDFPSPVQFNHAIVAIEVDPSVQLPSVVEWHGKHLLFFDPTDEFTTVGDIPDVLQGTYVQVLSPDCDGLLKLPQIPSSTGFLIERKISFKLEPSGAVKGEASVCGVGQRGARLRYELFKNSRPEDVQKHLEALMTRRLRGSHFVEGASADDPITGRCTESFSLAQTRFLQPMPGNLALAHLDVFASHLPNFSAHERQLPIRLQPHAESDEVSVELPEAFAPAELPADMSLKSEYGEFSTHFEVRNHTVIYHRHLEVSAQTIPASDYAKVKKFFADVAKSDKAPLLLNTSAKLASSP